ncbi:MAG TPA: GAF domain-containing sensor histidine kinase [Anaerolineales bacterium]
MVLLTREQLEDRLLALHQASLELVRNLSLDQLLERIVHAAREQAGARYAALGVVGEDGDMVRFIPVGMTPEEVRKTGRPPRGLGMIGAVQEERRTIRIPEILADSRSTGFPQDHPEMKSFLGVPIMLGERLLGEIYLTEKIDHHEFTETDEQVIEMLAAYAAVAISNARLYKGMKTRDQELTKRNEDLALVNRLAEAVASSLELEEILDHTLEKVMEHLEVEAGEIFLTEEGRQGLRLALHRGEAADAFWTRDRFRFGEGYIGIVAQTGKPLTSGNPQKDLRYLRPAVIEAGFHCIACVPLTVSGSVIGVMSVATRRERRFNQREVDLLMAIGTWAGLSIENARLHRQAQRLAVLEERERIGMDLHDGIIQSIYGVGLALDYARVSVVDDPTMARKKIEQAIDGLNNAIRDIRSYILDLRPRQFRGEDLMAGLQKLVEEFSANSSANTVLDGPKDGLISLPTANATTLFHICQEALANIAKHAHADHAEVRLRTTNNRVLLQVSDDGQGFDLRKMNATLGHGLSNMQARAHKVGGDVEINSAVGEGTAVIAWVPKRE